LIVVGGFDRSLSYFTADEGRLFRKFLLSSSSYPIALATHDSGLLIAVAMSASEILLIDAMSGDAVLVFNSLSCIVTALAFHDADLLVSTIGGTLMRWTIPQHVQNELQVKQLFPAPDQDGAAPLISTSLMTSVEAERPPLIDADDAIEEAQPEVGESDDPPNSPRVEEDIDAPRDPLDNTDKRINDFIRSSFVARRNPVRLRLSSDDEPEVLRLFPGEIGGRKPVAIEMPPEIQPISDEALKSMMDDSLLNDDDAADDDDDAASSTKSEPSPPPEIEARCPDPARPLAPDPKPPKEPAQEPKKSPPQEPRKAVPPEAQKPPAAEPKRSPSQETRKLPPPGPPKSPEPTKPATRAAPHEPRKPSPSEPQKASIPNAVTPLAQEPKKLLPREPRARSPSEPVKTPDAKKLLPQEPRRPPPADAQEAKGVADAKKEPSSAMPTKQRSWGDAQDTPLPEPVRIAPPEVKRSIRAELKVPSLADQIRETTAELRQLFEDARVVLSKEYADEPERAAQQRMREVIESIDAERQDREERTRRIVSVLSQLKSNVTGISDCLDAVARDSDSLVGLLS
jgi:hypothetical protein